MRPKYKVSDIRELVKKGEAPKELTYIHYLPEVFVFDEKSKDYIGADEHQSLSALIRKDCTDEQIENDLLLGEFVREPEVVESIFTEEKKAKKKSN